MLRISSIAVALLSVAVASAQIDIPSIIERKAKERAERKVEQTIDKGFDKTEEGVDKGTKEATKGKKDKKNQKDKQQDQGVGERPTGATSEGGAVEGAAGTAAAKPSLNAYSKFDFVAGEQVIAVEDFMQDAVGDFPARWNTNTSGEVVTIDGQEGHWLKLTGKGVVYPEFLAEVPDNATVEFDVMVNPEYSFYCNGVDVKFVDARNKNLLMPEPMNMVTVGVHPQSAGSGIGTTAIEVKGADHHNIMRNDREQKQLVHRGIAPKAHVAIWRQKQRVRMYLNEEKMWDLPRAFQPDASYRMIIETGACEGSTPFIGNVRIAQGAPDTRNKLITEGRLVTRGILFDSGSERIKAESYGTLKDIGTVLAENAAVRVRIIGHTDSDGEDAANTDLSKRRADAVKDALSKEFGIDAARMETDGKGESVPAGANDTPQGKANNRRVEFVKL
jgi:outer membrane protein OmpA-like peptidoglycan-associated protein